MTFVLLCVCVCVCVYGMHVGAGDSQMMLLHLLQLELHTVGNCLTDVLGTELGFSGRAARTLNYWIFSPARQHLTYAEMKAVGILLLFDDGSRCQPHLDGDLGLCGKHRNLQKRTP